MHMKAVTEGAREAALGIIMWSNQSRCWCNRWLAANGEGKLQPYLNEWRQRRKDTAYLVSESLHWATAPPVGQGLDSIGKDGFELVHSRLSYLFFSTDIFTHFVKLLLGNRSMSSLLFLLPLCSVVYCVYFGKESLTFWLAHPEFELFWMIFPMCLGLDSWCKFFWSWNGTISLFLFIYFIVICYCRFLVIFNIFSSYLPWTLVTQPSS